MTTYILAGGNDRMVKGYGKHLAAEIIEYVPHPKILSCFFSLPESEWSTKFNQFKEWFEANFTDDFTYEYAQKDTFLQQIKEADIIYLHGGSTQLLFDALLPIRGFVPHLKNKVVVGSSAGANVLSKKYWSSTRAIPCEGLGVLDVNIMVHYGAIYHDGVVRTAEDWHREEAEFQAFVGDGEITHLPEGQFIVAEAT